jgi:uncharacterized membrane protein
MIPRMSRLIIPNFHVILIHFPLAFFGFGLFIEIFSFMWKKSSFHQAGRWMILLGTLALAPTATSGIYALFDVVGHGQAASTGWSDLKNSSGFSDADWHQAHFHVLLTGIASGLALVVVVVWLGGSDLWRGFFYWPGLILLMTAMGMLTIGAWHGGEMIFRQGFGVEGRQPVLDAEMPSTQPTMQDRIEAVLPAIQVHLIMAGLVIAGAAGAMGTGFRRAAIAEELQQRAERAELQRRLPERLATEDSGKASQGQTQTEKIQTQTEPIPLAPNPAPPNPSPQNPAPEIPAPQVAAPTVAAPTVPPAENPPIAEPVKSSIAVKASIHVHSSLPVVRLWLLAAVFALVTIFAGLYFSGNLAWPNILNVPGLNGDLSPIRTPGERRTAIHIVFGGAILLFLLVMALLGRMTPRDRRAMGIISAVLTLLIAAQVWIGILLLYDGGDGPLMHFK